MHLLCNTFAKIREITLQHHKNDQALICEGIAMKKEFFPPQTPHHGGVIPSSRNILLGQGGEQEKSSDFVLLYVTKSPTKNFSPLCDAKHREGDRGDSCRMGNCIS